jgi:NADH-quinone oxidoreductase subunit A
MSDQLQQFGAVGVLFVLAVAFAALCIFVPSLVGKRRSRHPVKDQPYECGLPASPDDTTRFSVRFYLVAMLFILFDLEVVFVVTWATQYKKLIRPLAEGGIGAAALWSMLLFLVILEIGHFYVWRQGALNWSDRRRAPAAPS